MSTSDTESASDKVPSFVVKSNSRLTGSKLRHAFALQDCLLQQMLSNSDICDVTLRMGEMVLIKYIVMY